MDAVKAFNAEVSDERFVPRYLNLKHLERR
jgi:hypothetical protein